MGKMKEEKIDLDHIKPEEELKYEIAKELGYLDKVMATGWKSLTAKESGRIGGIMTKKRKEEQKKKEREAANLQDDLSEDIMN
jgi:Small, acid-soluble spore proteins, alpha/beta type.